MFTINGLPEYKDGWSVQEIGTKEIWNICQHLREEDKQEIMKCCGSDNYEKCVFDLVFHYPHPVYKIMYKKDVIGIGGICKSDFATKKAIIFLAFTPMYKKHKFSFLRFSRVYLKRLVKAWGTLTNIVWLKNTGHIQYLDWLGAKWIPVNDEFSIFELGGEK